MTRRLAAIMFTDIVGFTALTQRDEKAALQLLREQESLVLALLETHRGRQVKSTGDGFLLEFSNALDAIEYAVDLQRRLHERNARPGSEPLRLRMAIHLGDVQDVGTDIFGDAINIAAHILALADPGGVCLSEPVYVQVRNKVPCQLEKLGTRTFKDVQGPMDLYRVVLPWEHEEVSARPLLSRRLAAIMYTDVVGFTASAQANEADALARLREQEGIVRPLFEPYKGREIKSTGDGFLVEFESALGALECAIEIHRRMRERNSQKPRMPLELRIGLHVGDVEESGGDIFGDAVNIASRVEPLADPGGVCLSAQVYDQVHNKVPYLLERLGPKSLKGVREPMEIYRVVLPWVGTESTPGAPHLPRLAVLPLANISPDPKDEYIADGLTEELISVLSQIGGLRVIARTSVIQYKSSPKPIPQVGAELGVSAVLEGSVRKAGDRLRITAQLIDVASQEHTWSASYDRRLDDIFAVQTEVARQIAQGLEIKIAASEGARLREKPTTRPDSYLAYLKGRTVLAGRYSAASILRAKEQFELAIAIDPANARAFSGLADALFLMVWWGGPQGQRSDWDDQARMNAARAVELDPGLAEAHCSLAAILWEDRDYPAAEKEFRKALALNPSYADAHRLYANLLMDAAQPEDALREIALAEELDPQSVLTKMQHAMFLGFLRRADEVKVMAEQIGRTAPDSFEYHAVRTSCCWAAQDFAGILQEDAKMRERDSYWGGRSPSLRVFVLALTGKREEASSILREIEAAPGRDVERTQALAGGYALLGDFERAFRFLNEGMESHALAFQAFRIDPIFESLRGDPRFGQLLKRMKLA